MSVNARWGRRQGDEDDTIVARVGGIENGASIVSVVAHVRYGAEPFETLDADVTAIDPTEVTVQLGGASGWLSDAKQGCWRLTLVFMFVGDIGPISWPEPGEGTAEITVGPPG